MNIKFTLSLLAVGLLQLATANAQTPLTLNATNFPKVKNYNTLDGSALTNVPVTGTNLTLDYGAIALTAGAPVTYKTVTDPYFTSSCDAYYNSVATVGALSYLVDYYYTTNNNLYGENAMFVPGQAYDISAGTGGLNDSIIFPVQRTFFNQARTILHFPATAGYTYQSNSRRAIDFNLTVAMYALNHMPGQHVMNVIRHDTITAWGKMRLYTAAGPTVYYDVLGLKSWQYQADSFYLGGLPAPAAMLSGFGVTQGMHTFENNRMSFFRANRAAPLVEVNYDSSPFSSFSMITVDADSLTLATGITTTAKAQFATLVYPNPTSNGAVTIEWLGSKWATVSYQITDAKGSIVQTADGVVLNNNKLAVQLAENVPSGLYFITVRSTTNQLLATETINKL